MSIYDKAGVALIPSGYKAGTTDNLYSVLPANGNGDFNATRGSSATRVNKDGLIESVATNVPRLDYPLIDGVVQDCPALLLEPSRTNDLQRTEEFDNSYWSKSNGTATANQTISPDGSQNADKFAENTATTSHHINRSGISIASGVSHTLSVFVKANGRNTFRLFSAHGSTSSFAYFNLETKNIGSKQSLTASKIEEYPNDWYRCSITFTSASTSAYVQFLLAQDNETTSYTGDGSSGMYFWGAQLEEGSYPTSYIPWDGSGSTTRSADACYGSGTSAEFNDSEGVLFAEIAFAESQSSSSHRISLSNGTTSYRMIIQQNNNATPNRLQFYFIVTPSAQTDFQHTLTDITQFNKIAFKYKENDFAVWVNGVEVLTDTSGVTFPEGTVNQLNFDDGVGGNLFFGKVKQALVFNEALSDSELATLTS